MCSKPAARPVSSLSTTDDNLGLSQDKLRKSAPDLCILHRGTHSITCTVWEGSPCESPIMGTIQCSRIFHGTGTFFCPRQHLVNIPTCSFPSAKPTDQVCPTWGWQCRPPDCQATGWFGAWGCPAQPLGILMGQRPGRPSPHSLNEVTPCLRSDIGGFWPFLRFKGHQNHHSLTHAYRQKDEAYLVFQIFCYQSLHVSLSPAST